MLKRSLAVLACVLLLVCCLSVTAFAAETSKASVAVTANKETAKIGDTVTFTVSLVNAGAVEGGVWNYNVYVSVGAGLKIESAAAGSGFDGMYFDVSGNQVHGSSFGATAGLTSGATLGTITCTVTADAANTVSASVTSASLTEKVDGGLVSTVAGGGSDSVEIVTEHTHAWGEWKTVKEPTCTEKGLQERKCACGAKETREIAALGHSENVYYVDLCEAECGLAASEHAIHCERCDAVIGTEEHSMTKKVIQEWVQFEKDGVDEWSCSKCTHKYRTYKDKGIDDNHETGDVTGQVILGTTAVVLMMGACAAFVFKRKTVR